MIELHASLDLLAAKATLSSSGLAAFQVACAAAAVETVVAATCHGVPATEHDEVLGRITSDAVAVREQARILSEEAVGNDKALTEARELPQHDAELAALRVTRIGQCVATAIRVPAEIAIAACHVTTLTQQLVQRCARSQMPMISAIAACTLAAMVTAVGILTDYKQGIKDDEVQRELDSAVEMVELAIRIAQQLLFTASDRSRG